MNNYFGKFLRIALLGSMAGIVGCNMLEEKPISTETQNGVTKVIYVDRIEWKREKPFMRARDCFTNGEGTLDEFLDGNYDVTPCNKYDEEQIWSRNLMKAYRKACEEGSDHAFATALSEYDKMVADFNKTEASQ